MNRKGFTLAEILVTLGIIGVVAALTAPALAQNAGSAKIGPTLQKVVSTIETANEQILVDKEASTLSGALGFDMTSNSISDDNVTSYLEELSKHISGSSYSTEEYKISSYDGSSSVSLNNMVFKFNNYLFYIIIKLLLISMN